MELTALTKKTYLHKLSEMTTMCVCLPFLINQSNGHRLTVYQLMKDENWSHRTVFVVHNSHSWLYPHVDTIYK